MGTKQQKMETNFFIQIIQRVANESPKFFKIIQWVAAILAITTGAATALIAHHIWAPVGAAKIQDITSLLWPILTTVFAMSALPVKDQTTIIKQS